MSIVTACVVFLPGLKPYCDGERMECKEINPNILDKVRLSYTLEILRRVEMGLKLSILSHGPDLYTGVTGPTFSTTAYIDSAKEELYQIAS